MSKKLEQFQGAIKQAMRGRSIAGTATSAGLPRDAIGNVLNGHEPRLERAAAICEVLGLEFYIGPPSVFPAAATDLNGDEQRSLHERIFGTTTPVSPASLLRVIQRAARELVALTEALGSDPVPEDMWPVLYTQTAEGIKSQSGPGDLPKHAQPVDIIQVEAAAGDGNGNGSMLGRRKGWIWFRRGWLEKRGLDPETCVVIGVQGDSMWPTLPDGSSILVDRASNSWTPSHLLVLRSNGNLLVKRASTGQGGKRMMASDHPDWPDTPLPEDTEIVGRVRWMAHGFE